MTDDRLYQLIVKRHYELRSIDDKGKIDIDQMNRMVLYVLHILGM